MMGASYTSIVSHVHTVCILLNDIAAQCANITDFLLAGTLEAIIISGVPSK